MKTKLTKSELEILRLLADGKTYPQIQRIMAISQPCLHTHCHHIRQKSDIQSTKSKEQCHAFLHGYSEPAKWLPPITPRQMEVLRLIAQGKTYVEIANELGMGPQTVQNHAHKACLRAGIARMRHRRNSLIREFLKSADAPQVNPMHDPMF